MLVSGLGTGRLWSSSVIPKRNQVGMEPSLGENEKVIGERINHSLVGLRCFELSLYQNDTGHPSAKLIFAINLSLCS